MGVAVGIGDRSQNPGVRIQESEVRISQKSSSFLKICSKIMV